MGGEMITPRARWSSQHHRHWKYVDNEKLINIEDNSRERVTKHEGDETIIIAIGKKKDKIFGK